MSQLSLIATSQPHAAYTVLTHGFSSKWKYYLRTNPNISDLLSPLEFAIHQQFLPTLIPHPPNDLERELFSLPVFLGGLGICDPCSVSSSDYDFSHEPSCPLVDLILCQHDSLPHDVIDSQFLIFKKLSQARQQGQVDGSMLHSLSSHAPLLPYVNLLSVVRARGLRHGFLLFHWNSMGSPFTRMNLLMLFVCVMAGLLLIYHPTVFVAKPFLSIMHLAVHMVLFPSSAITMFVISLRNYFQEFAMMFKLNHTSSP